MEESKEYQDKNQIRNETDNNDIFENLEASSSDPIPSLLLPIKKLKKPKSAISHIISNLKNNKMNLEQVRNKISAFLLNQNLQNHNSSPDMKNIMLIDDLIESKETHFIAIFKDYLISDYQEEFLRRYFNMNETIEVLPKFYQYYKNYLNFFCKGTFCDFDINDIMQEYGECQAEFYYNRNYKDKDRKTKRDKKENLNENNNNENNEKESNNNENENNMENNSKMELLKLIFTKSIEYSIEKVKNYSKNELLNTNDKKELSNIKPNNSKENTIILPDNSVVSSKDILTQENSLRHIISLMNKKKQRINLNKRIKNTKKEVLSKNNKYNELNKQGNIINRNKNNTNKKDLFTLSKTTSNLNIKNPKNNKNTKSRNKKSSIRLNYFTNNIYKTKNMPSISNYKKFIDILTSKQKNKTNKSNEPKIKIYQDEFALSSQKNNKKNKSKNIVDSININDIFNHINLFSTNNNYNNNTYRPKYKGNSSLFLLNGNLKNPDKNHKNMNYYNTIFPLSISKNLLNKNKYNSSKKSEKKEKKKSKSKDKDINLNNKYLYFNSNIRSLIKSIKNVSPKTVNNNNNINNNKALSYSTVNNCNININNNIILSNNYFNNKHHQINTSHKKISETNLPHKKFNINKSITKGPISRNNQNDLNRFKTDINMLNSLVSNEMNKNKIHITKNINTNTKFKLFRKSNEKLSKAKCVDNNKKYYNSNNHQRNLSLKNIPITIKNNLYNNGNYTSNKTGKLFDDVDFSLNSKTYKNLTWKKNNNTIQKKIIFDYKRK